MFSQNISSFPMKTYHLLMSSPTEGVGAKLTRMDMRSSRSWTPIRWGHKMLLIKVSPFNCSYIYIIVIWCCIISHITLINHSSPKKICASTWRFRQRGSPWFMGASHFASRYQALDVSWQHQSAEQSWNQSDVYSIISTMGYYPTIINYWLLVQQLLSSYSCWCYRCVYPPFYPMLSITAPFCAVHWVYQDTRQYSNLGIFSSSKALR